MNIFEKLLFMDSSQTFVIFWIFIFSILLIWVLVLMNKKWKTILDKTVTENSESHFEFIIDQKYSEMNIWLFNNGYDLQNPVLNDEKEMVKGMLTIKNENNLDEYKIGFYDFTQVYEGKKYLDQGKYEVSFKFENSGPVWVQVKVR